MNNPSEKPSLQHPSACRPTSRGPDIAAWVRSTLLESTDPSVPQSRHSMRGPKAVASEGDTNTPPLTKEPSSTSEYDAVSEVPSFPLPTMTSSKGQSPARSLSPKKRIVAKRKDLALLSPTIEFRPFREAEESRLGN